MWAKIRRVLEPVSNLLITTAVPVVVCIGVIRFLLTPAFIKVEYHLPHFPPDRYGFSREERLQYAQDARKYLVSDAGIKSLGTLEFEDGSPLFNERELSHMQDVKVVLKGTFLAFWGAVGVLLAGAAWKWRRSRLGEYWTALSRGGWLTVIFLAGVLFLSFLRFQSFFVVFHRLFFEGNTWVFRYSDTLIRLFPIQFWQDAFLFFGVLAAGIGLGLGFFGRQRGGGES